MSETLVHVRNTFAYILTAANHLREHHNARLHVLQRPGQERDDIADLEALWLSSRGQQRAAASTPGVQANNAGKQCQNGWCREDISVDGTLLAAVHCVPDQHACPGIL